MRAADLGGHGRIRPNRKGPGHVVEFRDQRTGKWSIVAGHIREDGADAIRRSMAAQYRRGRDARQG